MNPPNNTILQVGTIRDKQPIHLDQLQYGRDLQAYAIVHLSAGAGIYEDPNNGRVEVQQDQVLLLFPGLRHKYGKTQSHDHWSEQYVVFNGPLFQNLEKVGLLQREQPIQNVPAPTENWSKRLSQLILRSQKNKRWLHSHTAIAELHLLLSQLCEQHPQEEAWLEDAIQWLTSASSTDESIQSIAQKLQCSEQSFRKSFKRIIGLSPHQFRISHRIDQAANQLIETQKNIESIAQDGGFCDIYHFSRLFKKQKGISPARFRKLNGLTPHDG